MILGLETSGRLGSVALADGEATVGVRQFSTQQEACRLLPPALAALLAEAGIAAGALEGVAVSAGPGSFNGLRIGLALAKAMAHALGCPLVGVPTPQVWAAESSARFPGRTVAVLQPARRDHVYLTVLSPAPGLAVLLAPEVVEIEALGMALAALTAPVLTGDWEGLADWAAPVAVTADPERAETPSAVTVARLGQPLLATAPGDACFTLRPHYVGLSQAERTRGVDLGQ
ncbi:MAG TPA: tRNA (adenosine(37)-N6)-threonylcarbamoyltransferase complex dimerization subunit type 1 TsaB [Armatimonadota bacterium]|jgi:tRNA threonylcarbamoyladenosine biosynthesis protein TsaB